MTSQNFWKALLWTLIAGAGACYPALSQSVITTIAGTGFTFPSNGKPALSAPLELVFGVAVDQKGNVFLSSIYEALVMKVAPSGTLTVVAGNGIQGFSGDGGPATNASLSFPTGLAVDINGNLYISDSVNNRVRKVTPDGIISTFAGNGAGGYSGDGVPANSTSVFFPIGLAADNAGNIYIADSGNNRIRKVGTNGVISTVAGNGNAGFSGDQGPAAKAELNDPKDVAVDSSGNLYLTDYQNFRVRKVSTNLVISTIAGDGQSGFSGDGGPATHASLNAPIGVVVDASGNVFISDSGNQRVRKVTPTGRITTVAGNGTRGFSGDEGASTGALLADPQLLAVDPAGNLYIADQSNHRVRKISTGGTITTFAGNGEGMFAGDGGPSDLASLDDPQGVAVDQAGNLYIADTVNNRVREVGADGIISTVAGSGQAAYSGDGGPAVDAAMVTTRAVAVDSAGNLYIADRDNNRVRKVAPDGIITTVAGNGQAAFSGDGGPAVNAALNGPSGVAWYASGDLFIADTYNARVRKVSANGMISTIAGNGTAGFSGDGEMATNAKLQNPLGLAVDSSGNVYIADQGNQRIRKVASDGKISTVAGTGVAGFGGDNGPATSASLNKPASVAVDGAGNLYIADFGNFCIRRVSTDNTITTVAGNQQMGFSGDGGPATSASLNQPAGVAVDAAGRIYIADSSNNRIRMVLTAPPSIRVTSNQLSFSGNSTGPPTPVQTVQVLSSLAGVPFTVEITTKDGGTWLQANPVTGLLPYGIEISADPGSLMPGSYSGTVTVLAPVANPPSVAVAVSFQVNSAQQAALQVQPQSLSFSFGPGSHAATQQFQVANTGGGGALPFKAVATTAAGGNWLTVATASATITPAAPASLSVTADPTGLAPGTYSGQIAIATAASQVFCNVTIIVSANEQTIVLSQSGLTFTAVAGGGIIPQQHFAVLNRGTGAMKWSATVASGSPWLSVVPSESMSDPLSTVFVQIEKSGLVPGTQFGLIRVDAPSANNSPQFLSVVLNVVQNSANPIVVAPAGLIFTGTVGESPPGSQSVLVYNLSAKPINFVSSEASFGGQWLAYTPTNASVDPNQPTRIVVQPDFTNLTAQVPGIYFGDVNLVFQDGEIRDIAVYLVLAPGPNLGDVDQIAHAVCSPTKLQPVLTSLGDGFTVPASWPAPIEVQVVDDCGNPMTSGEVTASFSNSDPSLELISLENGMWSGTWQAQTPLEDVAITITAASRSPAITGSVQEIGGVQANQNQPFLRKVANSASLLPQGPFSPGSLISLFGAQLATGEASASPSLQYELANSQAEIGGVSMPLAYASGGQIDAQIPYDIPPNNQLQLLVLPGNAYTTPYPVNIAEASPAIFTTNEMGTGQGMVLDANGNLVGVGNAAKAGDKIAIYCTGLGAVNGPVTAGEPVGNPPPKTKNQVYATIGNVTATVTSSTLVAGSVGKYVVDAIVPPGVTPGDAVPVRLMVAGQTSPPVTIAIQ